MAVGVIFSLLSAILINLGNVVQKHAVSSLPEFSARRSGHLVRTLLSSRPWIGGFILCLFGLALQIMAFALAPIPVVQSIFNAGIVLLLVFSRIRLGERLGRREWFGIVVVVVSLIAVSASLGGTSDTLGNSGSALRVLVALVPTLLVVVLVVMAIQSDRGGTAFLYGLAAGLLYGAAALGTKGASTLVVQDGLIRSVPHILTSVYPYVFIVFSVFGMLMYQTGLQRYRISVVGSISDVVSSTYVVAVGMVVFGESLPKNGAILTLRLVGFVGILVGSVLVATAGTDTTDEAMTPAGADLGLGPVLAAEVGSISGHSVEELVTGVVLPGEADLVLGTVLSTKVDSLTTRAPYEDDTSAMTNKEFASLMRRQAEMIDQTLNGTGRVSHRSDIAQ